MRHCEDCLKRVTCNMISVLRKNHKKCSHVVAVLRNKESIRKYVNVCHRLSTTVHRKSKTQPREDTNASNRQINNRRAKSKTTMQINSLFVSFRSCRSLERLNVAVIISQGIKENHKARQKNKDIRDNAREPQRTTKKPIKNFVKTLMRE